MQYALLLLLVIQCILLWRIASAQPLTGNLNDWVLLEWHKVLHAGDGQKATWDSDSPMYLEFVPVIGWANKNGKAIPTTPASYRVWERLNASPLLDKNAKYETFGYWIRDGAIFDIDDMGHGDLWERLYDYAFAGHDIEVRGNIPNCYREKFSEIMEILVKNRTKNSEQQHDSAKTRAQG